MTVHLVTFSDSSMSRARDLCADSAIRHGVDLVMPLEGALEGTEAYQQHPALFASPRGLGYWAWKPVLIDFYLRNVLDENDGDILVYADAGVEFINNVSHIIGRMDQDIFLFGNNWEHAHWCKRNIVEVVWPIKDSIKRDERNKRTWERFGKQCQASVIFFRVSDYTRKFVAEWLKWCLWDNGHLIDDSPAWFGNHPEFRENRHDQAILTTLAYREGIKLHWWPASYNDGAFSYEKIPEYAEDDYPIMFNHHRRRNHEWENAA